MASWTHTSDILHKTLLRLSHSEHRGIRRTVFHVRKASHLGKERSVRRSLALEMSEQNRLSIVNIPFWLSHLGERGFQCDRSGASSRTPGCWAPPECDVICQQIYSHGRKWSISQCWNVEEMAHSGHTAPHSNGRHGCSTTAGSFKASP